MTVIVCLDNANGMMFNHRRQSRDANVVKDILKTINGASLLIAPYSESLFSQAECSVSISESFLADADAKDYCFVENTSVAEFKEKISRLVIYKWNRDYPADFYFDIDYASDYKLETTLDFASCVIRSTPPSTRSEAYSSALCSSG